MHRFYCVACNQGFTRKYNLDRHCATRCKKRDTTNQVPSIAKNEWFKPSLVYNPSQPTTSSSSSDSNYVAHAQLGGTTIGSTVTATPSFDTETTDEFVESNLNRQYNAPDAHQYVSNDETDRCGSTKYSSNNTKKSTDRTDFSALASEVGVAASAARADIFGKEMSPSNSVSLTSTTNSNKNNNSGALLATIDTLIEKLIEKGNEVAELKKIISKYKVDYKALEQSNKDLEKRCKDQLESNFALSSASNQQTTHNAMNAHAIIKRERLSPTAASDNSTGGVQSSIANNHNPEELLNIARDCLSASYPEEETISRTWALKLKRLQREQRLLAEKFINDVLFEAESGTLHRGSIQINAFEPYVHYEEQSNEDSTDQHVKSQSPVLHPSSSTQPSTLENPESKAGSMTTTAMATTTMTTTTNPSSQVTPINPGNESNFNNFN